jgi:NTP pyrophosphatase (non-canonical NTP hydrolase)
MPKSSPPSPLVAAAAAVDAELREYDDLAREAKHVALDGEKALARAARLLSESTQRQPRIQEKLKALVGEIEGARLRQQQSLDMLVETSRALEARANEFDALMRRFAAVGESAQAIHRLTSDISNKKNSGASESDLLEGLRQIEEHMGKVITDAEDLAREAERDGWPEMARQADSIRQQVGAAKNKLTLAYKTVAARAPS